MTLERLEKLAWWYSIMASISALLIFIAFLVSMLQASISSMSMNESQKSLLQRKIMLQARIELCNMRERGELPANSQQCIGDEAEKLPGYRAEIEQIDRSMRSR